MNNPTTQMSSESTSAEVPKTKLALEEKYKAEKEEKKTIDETNVE